MSDNSNSAQAGSNLTKALIVGATSIAAVIFSYFIYQKYVKSKRSESSSSDSGDEAALISSIKKNHSAIRLTARSSNNSNQNNSIVKDSKL